MLPLRFDIDSVAGHPPASRFARRVPLTLREGGLTKKARPIKGRGSLSYALGLAVPPLLPLRVLQWPLDDAW